MFADALPSFVNARSPRVRMGLGTIARIVASGEEIYASKLRFAEAQTADRASSISPYHQALRRLVDETEALFGGYLLVDCHSMPSAPARSAGASGADIVLGDCHGAACAPRDPRSRPPLFGRARASPSRVNAPYAGGFTTDHYGDPGAQRHALQIEINRALYMDERNYQRKPCFARLAGRWPSLSLGWAASPGVPGRAAGRPPRRDGDRLIAPPRRSHLKRTAVAETSMSAIGPNAADFTIEQDWRAYSEEEHAVWRLLFERQQRLLVGARLPRIS